MQELSVLYSQIFCKPKIIPKLKVDFLNNLMLVWGQISEEQLTKVSFARLLCDRSIGPHYWARLFTDSK